MRFVVVHSNANYLTGLRLPLLRHLRRKGEVIALAPGVGQSHITKLAEYGITARAFSLDPTGFNPLRDTLDVVRLAWLLRTLKPDVVITNTAKPVIFGTFAASLAGARRRFAMVSGLGYAFTDDGRPLNFKKQLTKHLTGFLYKHALPLNQRVFFHNSEDLREFVALGICPEDRAVCVRGSGVDVHAFTPAGEAPRPVFIMVARLLAEKGVREYLQAARMAKTECPEAHFLLVGGIVPSPMAITRDEVLPYVEDGTLEWPGAVEDVRVYLRRASIFVLPSYREGLPRSALEAMAMGLAVISTDVPGCRETVPRGDNGILVPVRDPKALAHAMVSLARDLPRVAAMGKASRALAESVFDVEHVHRQMDAAMAISDVHRHTP